MYRLQLFVVALLFSASALGQAGAAANVNASASQNTSVSANKSGAQAQSNPSANAGASAQASHQDGDHESASKPQSRRDSAGTSGADQLASGTMINAALVKPVDARKNKPGDTVMAKTTQDVRSGGQVVIPKGAGIVGHVTQTNTRAAGSSESSLGIVFDHAILKNGQEVPINTSIQAIAAAQTAAASATDDMGSIPASGIGSSNGSSAARTSGGLLGGVGATAGAAGGAVTNTTADLGRTAGGTMHAAASAGGSLNSTSSGIVGLGGMTLNSATSAGAQGSVITSAGKNIHLDSGTQMLLKVTGSATQK